MAGDGEAVEFGGIGAGETDGGFEVVGALGGEGFVAAGLGEEFVFLTGGFDFGFPGVVGEAFEFHEVGHVVAGVGEGGAGFVAELGVCALLVVEFGDESGEFLAGGGELFGEHFGFGGLEADALGEGGLVLGEGCEGFGVGFDGGGPVLVCSGGAGVGEVGFGGVEAELVLAGAEVVGGEGDGEEAPEG